MYKVLSLKESEEWNDYLKRLPINQQDVYYTPEYYNLYENNGDGKAFCFVFEKEEELALYPFLKNSINKLGYDLEDEYYDIQGAYGYNGVITSSYNKSFIRSFYKCFDEYCKNHRVVAEFIRFHPLLDNHLISESYMDVIHNRLTIAVNLDDDLKQIFSNFSKSNKRAIKKAEKNDVFVEILKFNYKVDGFKILYLDTMKKVDSIDYLLFSEKYFSELFSMKNIVQFNAYYNDELIASTVCFHSANYFHYHLGCSKSEFLEFRPNNLLFKNMITHAKSIGCKYLYLGGGNTLINEDSLLRFKSSFSNVHYNFFIGKKIYLENIYNKIKLQFITKDSVLYDEKKEQILGYRSLK